MDSSPAVLLPVESVCGPPSIKKQRVECHAVHCKLNQLMQELCAAAAISRRRGVCVSELVSKLELRKGTLLESVRRATKRRFDEIDAVGKPPS
jgi:hypothetical protein